jgi:hypothetical protein
MRVILAALFFFRPFRQAPCWKMISFACIGTGRRARGVALPAEIAFWLRSAPLR